MSSEVLEIDIAVIGAGVVGLAIAEDLARSMPGRSIAVFERHGKFGQEISSHNSEVIHAGIYYQGLPEKARHCVRGKELLYEFCAKNDVPLSRCGKFIVASEAEQAPALEKLFASAASQGVALERLTGEELRRRLGASGSRAPYVEGLFSESTGIVDSHVLMERLESRALAEGVMILYRHSFHRVLGRSEDFDEIELLQPEGESLVVRTRMLVNAAGLAAARIASQYHPEAGFQIFPCRGRYFSLSGRWSKRYSSLIYPLPDPAGGLGVHLTFDLSGRCRLGPDVDWSCRDTSPPDAASLYQFDNPHDALQERFFVSGRKLLPELVYEDLCPDYVGVRPKLFRNGTAHPDFLLFSGSRGARDLHLLGIESPGLTAALSLAEEVGARVAAVV